MRRLALCVCAASCAACVTGNAWPRVMTVADIRAQPVSRGEWIEDYDTALASIAAMMKNELGLPEPAASLVFHRDRAAFRAALEANGYEPEAARITAETLTAVSGHRRVLINEDGMDGAPWPVRIALLAHELAHTLQYEWSGGSRGTSDQWLREGFAEWVEVQALTRLGFTTPGRARATVLGRIRDAGGARSVPALSEMITFPEWVMLASRVEQEALYGYAWLAAELLIERHGLPRVIAYFELFARSGDRVANFRQAFGEELPQFEVAAMRLLRGAP
jgi:hypothetical protein